MIPDGVIVLRTDAALEASALTVLSLLAKRFPGRFALEIACGDRLLRLGTSWRYAPTEACLAAFREFGEVDVRL